MTSGQLNHDKAEAYNAVEFCVPLTLRNLIVVPLLRRIPRQAQRRDWGQCGTSHHQKEGCLNQALSELSVELSCHMDPVCEIM